MNRLITPELGPTTTTASKLTAVATTIPVDSTTGFDSAGTIAISLVEGGLAEIVTYSGVTATSFTGCTRGTNSTVAAAYPFASYVAQVQWMPVIDEADTIATTTELADKNATIQYQNEGVDVSTKGAIQYINFVGSAVDVTAPSAGHLEVAVTGGGGDIALTKNAPSTSQVITAGYSAYVVGPYEIATATSLEIGAGACLEIG